MQPEDFGQPVRRYPKSSIILFQGEIPRYGFVVRTGYVKVYAIDNDGNEKVVGIYSADDIFPADWLLSETKAVMFYYETLEDSELLPVSKSDCAESDHVNGLINKFLARETTSAMLRNLALQQSHADNKILYFFFYLAVRHGKERGPGLYSLGLPLTHQFIADNLGLTRETVATEISKLKKASVVVYKKKHYVVDKGLLIRTVGKEITSNYVS